MKYRKGVRGGMLIDAFRRAQANFPGGGTVLEFGVWTGGSYLTLVEEILERSPNSSLIGFDSWCGLPEEADGVWFPERHGAGNFSSEKTTVLRGLQQLGVGGNPKFRLVDGFFSDSLTPQLQSEIKDLVYVNMDVDLYRSCAEALNFIAPLLRPGVTIYFDDWKDPADRYDGKWGEHLAWEEFERDHPEVGYTTVAIDEYNRRFMEITRVG